MKTIVRYTSIIILLGFGLLTLFLSSSVIFDWFDIRAKEGNYVLFVVWANFISSIIYLISVYGFIELKKWTTKILGISVIILLLTFLGLLMYIKNGGIYETKTIGAMIFRISITLVYTILAYFSTNKKIFYSQ